MRATGVPLFSASTPTARPATSTSSAFNLSAELTYTNLVNSSTWPACRCGRPSGGPNRSADRRRRALHLQPRADRRLRRPRHPGRRRGGRLRDHRGGRRLEGSRAGEPRHDVLLALAGVEGVYVPSMYDVDVRRPAPGVGHPQVPRRAGAGREAHHRRPRRVAVPASSQLVPLTEVVHDRLNVEVFRGCTRGCRFCQAGMITRPVRERPAEQVRTMVLEGLRAHRLRRGGAHVAVLGRLLGHRDVVERHRRRPRPTAGRSSVSLPSLRVDAFGVGIAAQIQKARRTGLTFAPEAGTWRMRQVINKLIREEDLYEAVDVRLLAGLAADEALLPHRPPDRDRRGHARHRRPRPQRARGRAQPPQEPVGDGVGRRVRAQAAHARSSGSARTPRSSSSARSTSCATPPARERGVDLKWHDPKATLAEGLASRGDRRLGAGHRGGVASGRHVPGVVGVLRPRPVGRGDGRARPRHRVVRATATAPRTRCSRGTTSRPASTRTSSGRTGATRSPRSACPTAAGPPATTAAPAPATRSSTSSPRPPRPPAAARAPARTSGSGAGPSPVHRCWRRKPEVVVRHEDPPALHRARPGPVRVAPRHRPRVGARHPQGRSCPSPTARGSRPDRGCTSGSRCRWATSRRPSTSTSTCTSDVDVGRRCRPCSRRACPTASMSPPRSRWSPTTTPSLQSIVDVCHVASSRSTGDPRRSVAASTS